MNQIIKLAEKENVEISSLKQQLDVIDQEVINDIADKCYEYHLKVEIGMWLKGKIVEGEFVKRGEGLLTKYNFLELEEETGRTRQSLKRWHSLYIDNPDEKKYLEIAKQKAEEKSLNWLKKVESLTFKETGELDNNWLKVYDIWNFTGIDYNFGIRYPGNIPAGIILNILYYFTSENSLVIDPMAGGGVIIDCCNFLNRRCLAYDIQPIREDIKVNDILKEYPDEANDCDLIFLDPPYYKKKETDYGIKSISALSKEDYLNTFDIIAKNSFNIIKENGYLAFLMEPYIDYKQNQDSIWVFEYIIRFLKQGWQVYRIFDVPETTQRYQAFDVARAKKEKEILTIRRQLVIFKKWKRN